MEKYVFDKSNGLWYELQGDYYIPCLTVPVQEERPIGIWGQRHLRYIKKERKALYRELLTSGKLNTYLAEINEKAEDRMLLLTKQMAEREGVTEQLKAEDQNLWVQRMNNIWDRATEIVNHELIYAYDAGRRGVIPAA
ncbi:MAG: TnpV protein [Clostridia bacterium]|nr:MAG: TnpV protein [Clostridia bacterium]